MQVNNVNNNQQNFGMAYRSISRGSQKLFKDTIPSKLWSDFEDIINQQKKNTKTEISVHRQGEGSKFVLARIKDTCGGDYGITTMKQRLWENHLGFLKRVNKKADEIAAKMQDSIDKDAIFKNMHY